MGKVVAYVTMVLDFLFLLALFASAVGLFAVGIVVFTLAVTKVAPVSFGITLAVLAAYAGAKVWNQRSVYGV